MSTSASALPPDVGAVALPRQSAPKPIWALPLVRALPFDNGLASTKVRTSASLLGPYSMRERPALLRGTARTKGTAQMFIGGYQRGRATAPYQAAKPIRELTSLETEPLPNKERSQDSRSYAKDHPQASRSLGRLPAQFIIEASLVSGGQISR
jgi:hypothetical protein